MLKVKTTQFSLIGIRIEFNDNQDFLEYSSWVERHTVMLNIFNTYTETKNSSHPDDMFLQHMFVYIICDVQTGEILKKQSWR